MLYTEVKLKYSCPAAVPKNVFLDRIYYIGKDNKGLFFTDNNYKEYAELEYIKMLFNPIEDLLWSDVEFETTSTNKNITKLDK